MATVHDGQRCPYCASTDTIDCGDIDIGTGEHHFECRGCRCGFPVTVTNDDTADPPEHGDQRQERHSG